MMGGEHEKRRQALMGVEEERRRDGRSVMI